MLTITTSGPTTFLPVVSDAAGLRGLLASVSAGEEINAVMLADMAFPGPLPVESNRVQRIIATGLPDEWAPALRSTWSIPAADVRAFNVVRQVAGEVAGLWLERPGTGPCPEAALWAPSSLLDGVPLTEIPLALLTPASSEEHRAAVGETTPRYHPHGCGGNQTATEFGCPCSVESPNNPSWSPLLEWATRDATAAHHAHQLDELAKGSEAHRRLENKTRAWAKGRDALQAHALEYVNRLRDESLAAWADWQPPAAPQPTPSRSVLWH